MCRQNGAYGNDPLQSIHITQIDGHLTGHQYHIPKNILHPKLLRFLINRINPLDSPYNLRDDRRAILPKRNLFRHVRLKISVLSHSLEGEE